LVPDSEGCIAFNRDDGSESWECLSSTEEPDHEEKYATFDAETTHFTLGLAEALTPILTEIE